MIDPEEINLRHCYACGGYHADVEACAIASAGKGVTNMLEEYTVSVHLISDTIVLAPARDVRSVGEEGARRATAIIDGREVPIYNRVEWGFLWEEQEPAEMYHCQYCGQHHPIGTKEFYCPLDPNRVK